MSAGRRTFILELEDDPGALNRVVSVLRQRSLNITSLSVAPSETPGSSRLTLVAEAGNAPRLALRLRKEVPVLAAEEVTQRSTVQRELALLRVSICGPDALRAIADTAARFGAKVAASGPGSAVVEVADAATTVDALAAALRPFGLLELARSGPVAILHEGHERRQQASEETEE